MEDILGIPLLAWISVVCFAVFAFVMAKTPFGRYVTLVGGNKDATFRAGIDSDRILWASFIVAGVLAGLAGWLLAIRTSGATANLGIGMLFNAFAAVVIGGVSLKGGIGKLPGVYAGVLLLYSIHTAINLMGLPAHYTQMILGGLVLAAVLLDTLKLRLRERLAMSGRLEGKVALVIGGARGIGGAVAARFAHEGAQVAIGDLEDDAGERHAEALGGLYLRTDISRAEDAEAAVAATLDRFGRLDILVQNAGIYPWTLIEDTSPEEWDRVVSVNLGGCFHAARAAVKPMKAQKSGRILFTSSITGTACHQPRPRPLLGHQGGHQRLHPGRGAGVRGLRHHRQRGRAGQHPDRGHEGPPQRRLHPGDGRRHPPRAASARPRTSPTPSSSSPRTRPTTSPARPSSSTAASFCPRATTSGSTQNE